MLLAIIFLYDTWRLCFGWLAPLPGEEDWNNPLFNQGYHPGQSVKTVIRIKFLQFENQIFRKASL